MSVLNPNVSIIIPHWNGIDILSECLDSLKKTYYKSYEIIVSDNNSEDGSQEWVKRNYPNVILLENEKNYGYSGGCNRGANIAKGEYLIFLNNDTVQDPNWLGPLVDIFEKDSLIAAVQPKILNYFNKELFDYAGGCGGLLDIFGYPFAKGRIFLEQEKDNGQYNKPGKCFWASGAAIMMRKDIFFSAGKLDPVFFSHMEEIDLCWRFQAMGYKVFVEPRSIIYHKNAISLPMNSQKKYYLNHRNSLIMIFSNYSLPLSFYIGVIRIVFEFGSLLYTLFKLDFKHFSGIILAMLWLIFHPITLLKKRYKFNKLKIVKDKKIMENMFKKSIVIEHFIFKKNSYSSLVSKVF